VSIDVGRTAENKEDDDCEFNDHNGIVEVGGFTNANDEESRHGQTNKDGREIEEGSTLGPDTMVEDEGGGAKSGGDVQAEIMKEFDGIAGPANGDSRRGEEVFEDQIPADDPGQKFA